MSHLAVPVRALGICVSGVLAWQAIRYYRGEIAIPVYDQGVAVLMGEGEWPASSFLTLLNFNVLLAAAQVFVGMVLVLAFSLYLLRWTGELGWRLQLGKAGYGERNAAALRSCEAGTAQRPSKSEQPKPQPQQMSWFTALILTPFTFGFLGLAVALLANFVVQVDRYLESIGLPWSTVSEFVAITVVTVTWSLGVLRLVMDSHQARAPINA